MDKNYKGLIWTNHALSRLKERNISQGDAWATFMRPDQSRYAATKGAWIYYKSWPGRRVEVVAKKENPDKWIILSVWSRLGEQPQKTKNNSIVTRIIKWIFNS